MTQSNYYSGPSARIAETSSFGTHRKNDRPASAVRNGASSMPAAWKQSKTAARATSQHKYGEPVRAFSDMALDPLRWVTANRYRMIGFAAGVLLVVAIIA